MWLCLRITRLWYTTRTTEQAVCDGHSVTTHLALHAMGLMSNDSQDEADKYTMRRLRQTENSLSLMSATRELHALGDPDTQFADPAGRTKFEAVRACIPDAKQHSDSDDAAEIPESQTKCDIDSRNLPSRAMVASIFKEHVKDAEDAVRGFAQAALEYHQSDVDSSITDTKKYQGGMLNGSCWKDGVSQDDLADEGACMDVLKKTVLKK